MLSIAKYTARGGRSTNEDTARAYKRGDRVCAVAADGLGGHGGGRIASRAAAKTILSLFKNGGEADPSWLEKAMLAANDEVLSRQNEKTHMKTTAAVVVIDEDRACFAHIGDTRIYHFHNGSIAWQSTDHSMSQLAVMMGEITPDGIRSHPDRSRLTRALGGDTVISPDIGKAFTLEPGFHAFLLCTDGFWEYVLENEMLHDLECAISPRDWLNRMRRRLERRSGDDIDNNTALVIFMDTRNHRKKKG